MKDTAALQEGSQALKGALTERRSSLHDEFPAAICMISW
jgi:hypothetical protein